MHAANSADSGHISVVGDEGKLESLQPALTPCHGRREDRGRARSAASRPAAARVRRCDASGTPTSSTSAGISAPATSNTRVSCTLRANRLNAEVAQEDGLRGVATGPAGHRSIDIGKALAIRDLLPEGCGECGVPWRA
jgi:myo-inositol 2-dehydrogenase/D-chiro-inositol 1-dehydrogenase